MMTEHSPLTRLAEIQLEEARLREQMAQHAAAWQRAAAGWVGEAWDQDVQRAIHSDPDTVKTLAAQGVLTRLKLQLTQLKEAAPEKTAELFGDTRFWSHIDGTVFETEATPNRADSSVYRPRNPQQSPRILGEPLRLLRGEALGLLADAGLLNAQTREAARRTGPRRRYPYAMDVSDEMSDRVRRYSQAYQAFVTLGEERRAIEAEFEREAVDRLWDEA